MTPRPLSCKSDGQSGINLCNKYCICCFLKHSLSRLRLMPYKSCMLDRDLALESYRWGVRIRMRAHGQFNGGEQKQRTARGQRPASYCADGATEAQRAKGTQRVGGRERAKLGPREGIRRLTWEVVKERQPGCKARRTQKKRSWEPRFRRRSGPKIQRPLGRWWTQI